jgi:D-xylose transport system permease protein
MTDAERNEAQAAETGSVAVAGQPEAGEAAEHIALTSAPEVMANSLGEYTRIWLRRVRSGESGALPVIIGLVIIGAYFQISQHAFLSAGNIANLMTQAGFLITLCMAQTFPLLLGEIDLSLGFNAGIGGTITLWMVSVHSPYPTWAAIVVGIAVCAAIAGIEGLLIVWLQIPSFVVTLAGLLGLNGVLLWLFDETGPVGNGGVIQLHNTFINALVNENMSPTVGWIVLIAAILVAGVYMIVRDRRRRTHNLVAPPISVTLLKIGTMAVVGLVLVLVLNHNRGVGLTVLSGVPWVVPIVLGLYLVLNVLLGRTKFGRYVYAIGGNAEAARRAGINLRRIRVVAFVGCGALAGVTGILYASFLGSISNDIQGGQYVLYAVAGAVIGGVSLFGGRGRMLGALLGGFVVAVIYNGVELLGLSAPGQYIWTALVLLAAVTVDALSRRGSTPT